MTLGGGLITLTRCRFVRCKAEYKGGGIYVENGRIEMHSTRLDDCSAETSGGGACVAVQGLPPLTAPRTLNL